MPSQKQGEGWLLDRGTSSDTESTRTDSHLAPRRVDARHQRPTQTLGASELSLRRCRKHTACHRWPNQPTILACCCSRFFANHRRYPGCHPTVTRANCVVDNCRLMHQGLTSIIMAFSALSAHAVQPVRPQSFQAAVGVHRQGLNMGHRKRQEWKLGGGQRTAMEFII